jgi:hypothetical protein
MAPNFFDWRVFSAIALLLCALTAIGCQREQIQKYSVVNLAARPAARSSPPAASAKPGEISRMVSAIARRADADWIFKITGSQQNVAATEAKWRAFLEQISFDESGQPKWELPEGWTQEPGNQFRFATLRMGDGDPPVEVAVTKMPSGQDVASNVNRWREQLGLPPLSASDVESSLKKMPAGEIQLLVFDESGQLSNAMPGMAAASAGLPPGHPTNPVGDPHAMLGPSEGANLPFEASPPTDWEPGPSSQFTVQRFIKQRDGQKATLAVTRLPANAQAWPDNVNMWRGELDLQAISREEVEQQTKEITVDGKPATSIFLKSAKEPGKASQVVCLTTETDSWFFKLTGDAELVADSQPSFDQFIQSIHFKSGQLP